MIVGKNRFLKRSTMKGGIKEFVTYLNKGKEALYPDVIYCEGEKMVCMLKLHSSITILTMRHP